MKIIHTPRGRRNHRPRRGERRHRAEVFDGDIPAALGLILFFSIFLDCISTACARKKEEKRKNWQTQLPLHGSTVATRVFYFEKRLFFGSEHTVFC